MRDLAAKVVAQIRAHLFPWNDYTYLQCKFLRNFADYNTHNIMTMEEKHARFEFPFHLEAKNDHYHCLTKLEKPKMTKTNNNPKTKKVTKKGTPTKFGKGKEEGEERQPIRNFTSLEDVFLLKAYVEVTLNPIKSCRQTANNFWSQVHDEFHKLMEEDPYTSCSGKRNADSLRNRFRRKMQGRNQSRFTRHIKVLLEAMVEYQKLIKVAKKALELLQEEDSTLEVLQEEASPCVAPIPTTIYVPVKTIKTEVNLGAN